MLIRPKSASRNRTRHTPSETTSFVPTSAESDPYGNMRESIQTGMNETTIEESMIPSIETTTLKLGSKHQEESNKLSFETNIKMRKRSISSQDHITRNIFIRDLVVKYKIIL